MNCFHCGADNPDNSVFCKSCGSSSSQKGTLLLDDSAANIGSNKTEKINFTPAEQKQTEQQKNGKHTQIYDGGNEASGSSGATRKLVGWLVSFAQNSNGIDYRLFEGRNIIGAGSEAAICINEPTISGKHAIILFRMGKFILEDQLSTNGTYLNNEFIEENKVTLNDGDIIKFGNVECIFRTVGKKIEN